MTENLPEVLILVGSPRSDGRSAELAGAVAGAFEAQGIHPTQFPLADYPVAACTGCGACSHTGSCIIVNDAWGVLSRHLDSADLLVVVAPVFFSGPSAWLKAALDRCQVYWARRYVLHQVMPADRPAHLFVLGGGGDPFGFTPLVSICTSALNCVGLRIADNIHDFVGESYDLARVSELVCAALEQVR